jgi:hypothetical protein
MKRRKKERKRRGQDRTGKVDATRITAVNMVQILQNSCSVHQSPVDSVVDRRLAGLEIDTKLLLKLVSYSPLRNRVQVGGSQQVINRSLELLVTWPVPSSAKFVRTAANRNGHVKVVCHRSRWSRLVD